jgi:hypothetical protein
MNDLIAALAKAGAPLLGTLIGGPVGTIAGAAIGALAEALGTPATPEAVKEAIVTGGPAAEAIVRRVEAEKAPDLSADLEAILRDRQAARDHTVALIDKGSAMAWGAPIVSIVVICGFVGLSFLAMKPESAGIRSDVALYLLGAWQSLATAVVGYWIGSSAGSASKDTALKQIASKR